MPVLLNQPDTQLAGDRNFFFLTFGLTCVNTELRGVCSLTLESYFCNISFFFVKENPCGCGFHHLKARSHCAFFPHCDFNFVYRNKWVVQDSMEVFTLCDCGNITYSYVAHSEQKTNRSRNHKKLHSVNEPLIVKTMIVFAVQES